jgi:hypothetical protein
MPGVPKVLRLTARTVCGLSGKLFGAAAYTRRYTQKITGLPNPTNILTQYQ